MEIGAPFEANAAEAGNLRGINPKAVEYRDAAIHGYGTWIQMLENYCNIKSIQIPP